MLLTVCAIRQGRVLPVGSRSRTVRVWLRDDAVLSVREIAPDAAPVAVCSFGSSDLSGPVLDVRVLDGGFFRPVREEDLPEIVPHATVEEICRAMVSRVVDRHGLSFAMDVRPDRGDPYGFVAEDRVAKIVSDVLPDWLAFVQGWIDANLVVVGGAVHVRSASPKVRIRDFLACADRFPDGFAEPWFPADGIDLWTCGAERWLEAFRVFDPAVSGNRRDWAAVFLRDGRDVLERAVAHPPRIVRPDLASACAGRPAPDAADWRDPLGIRAEIPSLLGRPLLPERPMARRPAVPVRAGRNERLCLPFLRYGGYSFAAVDLPDEDPAGWTEVARLGGIGRQVLRRGDEFLVVARMADGRYVDVGDLRPHVVGRVPGGRMRTIGRVLEDEAHRLGFPKEKGRSDRPWILFAKACGTDRSWRQRTAEDHADVFAEFCRRRLVVVGSGFLAVRTEEPWIEVRNTMEGADVRIRWSDMLRSEAPTRCALVLPLTAMDEALALASTAGRTRPSGEQAVEILDAHAFSDRDDAGNLATAVAATLDCKDARIRLLPEGAREAVAVSCRALSDAAGRGWAPEGADLDVVARWIDALSDPVMEGFAAPLHLVAAKEALYGARLTAAERSGFPDEDDGLDGFAM